MFNLIVGIILALLLPLTAYLLYREVTFVRECEIVSGTVTAMRTSQSSKGSSYAPDITMTLPNGEVMVYAHKVYSRPASFTVGERVPMGYRDGTVRIMHFTNRFGLSLILGMVCVSGLIYLGGRSLFDAHVAQRIRQQLEIEHGAR